MVGTDPPSRPPRLTRISHGPVRNAHGVPTFVGVSRESFRPDKLLATGDLLTNRKICEKVRLIKGERLEGEDFDELSRIAPGEPRRARPAEFVRPKIT